MNSIRGLGRPLEKDMATHSSILAWKNLTDILTWQVTVHSVAEFGMTERALSQLTKSMNISSYKALYCNVFTIFVTQITQKIKKTF